MSITIPLEIVGEIWFNSDKLRETLLQLPPGQHILLDINSEGASLGAFGIIDLLKETTHIYSITKWSNPVEPVPYRKYMCNKISHFFHLSRHYWINEIENNPTKTIFGLFIGRASPARNYILYDVANSYLDKFLLSKMLSENSDIWQENKSAATVSLDDLSQWANNEEQIHIKSWWTNNTINSIDNKHIREQFDIPEISAANCASSLLTHYHKFNIELICESYTRGVTFFPTEKTVRPIVGNKPFVVYGPKNYLLNLRAMGFKTFGNMWDESYDRLEGPVRWKEMRQVINDICYWNNEKLTHTLKQCAEITQHNRTRLQEIINDYKKL